MTSPFRRLIAIAISLAAPALVLAALLGRPAPAQAADVVVHTCTASGLKAAILAAGDSGHVTFDCTSGNPTIVLVQTQEISRDITIDGGGVITISGGNSIRIFSVPFAEKATLLNLSLTQGSSSLGSALRVTGLAVVTNVTFIENTSTGSGGALAVTGLGAAEIHLSHFFTNTADTGGAIHSAGGLDVDQSDFFDNTAFNGGALFQAGGPALVANSTFISNSSEFGGAIRANGSLALVSDEFHHNATPLTLPAIGHPGGGALHIAALGHVVVGQSVFFSNTAEVGGYGVGGAIVNEGHLTVLHSLFSQNTSPADGGAIFNSGNAAITRSTFLRNSTLGEGGAISNTGAVTLTTTTLFTNTADVSGGAIANGHQVYLHYSLLFNNSAPNGGGVRNRPDGTLLIESSTLYSNTALTGAGGAVLNNGRSYIFNSTLVENDAGTSGGAGLSIGSGAPELDLINTTVVSNTAASAGAALRQIDGLLGLGNTIVAFNAPDNCQGAIFNGGANLQFNGLSCGAGITNTNPLLGPLQDNGGPRIGVAGISLPTLLPLDGSPALDAAVDSRCEPTDERGYARMHPCDIGALERVFSLFLPLVER